jgi:subtilisin family serine protease
MSDRVRSHRWPALLAVLLLAGAAWTGAATALGTAAAPGTYEPGEILIQLGVPAGSPDAGTGWGAADVGDPAADPGAVPAPAAAGELCEAFAAAGLRPERLLSRRMGIWLFRFDAGNPPACRPEDQELLEAVRAHPAVLLAQLNHHVTPRSLFPNDPRFSEQWALNYTGAPYDPDIDAPEAWDLCTSGVTALGDTVVIAIVDDGSSLTHQDLRFWKNWHEIPGNGQDDDHNGYIDDYRGWNAISHNGTIPSTSHGTHVTGIAAAAGNNAIGVSGVNWEGHVLPIVGMSTSEAIAVEAYGYALEMRARFNASAGAQGAFVVVTNTSFGIDRGDPADYPLWCAMYDALGEEGVLSAGATANQNWNIDVVGDIPTACPSDFLIAVTCTTIGNDLYYRAGWGLTTIDLGAPGEGILSTNVNNGYATRTGTSQASPHVAGAVAMLVAASAELQLQAYRERPAEIALALKEAILRTVDPVNSLQGRSVSGGHLNLYSAVSFWRGSAGVPEGPAMASGLARPRLLVSRPNPFDSVTRIELVGPVDVSGGDLRLAITDVSGRPVRLLRLNASGSGAVAAWDGRDEQGRACPGGVYLGRVGAAEGSVAGRILLVR